jgi:hypothetical protein
MFGPLRPERRARGSLKRDERLLLLSVQQDERLLCPKGERAAAARPHGRIVYISAHDTAMAVAWAVDAKDYNNKSARIGFRPRDAIRGGPRQCCASSSPMMKRYLCVNPSCPSSACSASTSRLSPGNAERVLILG